MDSNKSPAQKATYRRDELIWYASSGPEVRLTEQEETLLLAIRRLDKVIRLDTLSYQTVLSILNPTTEGKRFYEFLAFMLHNEDHFNKLGKIRLDGYELDAAVIKLNEEFANSKLLEALNYAFLIYRKLHGK